MPFFEGFIANQARSCSPTNLLDGFNFVRDLTGNSCAGTNLLAER